MSYKKYFLLYILILTCCLTSCLNKQTNEENINSNQTETIEENQAETDSVEDIEITTDNKLETIYIPVDKENTFNYSGMQLEIKGVTEYNCLETELYTDVPADDNKYLVLFLKITNNTVNNDYISHENITAVIDGRKIKSTFLVNNPEGYPTIKDNISIGQSRYGYLVWEVPKNWTSIEIMYKGWEPVLHAVPVITLTPDSLYNPVLYENIDWDE